MHNSCHSSFLFTLVSNPPEASSSLIIQQNCSMFFSTRSFVVILINCAYCWFMLRHLFINRAFIASSTGSLEISTHASLNRVTKADGDSFFPCLVFAACDRSCLLPALLSKKAFSCPKKGADTIRVNPEMCFWRSINYFPFYFAIN